MTTTNKTRPDPLTTGSAATQDDAAAELHRQLGAWLEVSRA